MGSNFILFPLQILWGSIEITIFLFSLSKQIFEVYFFPNLNLKSSLKKWNTLNKPESWESVCKSRAIFRTQSSMELFCKNSERLSVIFTKSFIIDVRLDSKYASEKIDTFKMELRLAKSRRLLQRAEFFVSVLSLAHISVWIY